MPATSITVGQLLGHYRIVERIGGGGQGEVFRAHDERFDKDVALKILPATALSDDAARKQFRQEALAVGKLNHPNIATAFYFGEEHGVDFLVTEYIAGSGLDEKVKQGPLPEERVLALGAQLASGLDAAHHEGIIHRDLKPGNLRITNSGQLKILDFGLAELVDPMIDVGAAETVTLSMTLTGTLPYMAPEQFDGICDQRSDLWAVGVVLYEMATGQRPFPEAQLQHLKDAILHKEPARPVVLNPAISPGLERVILRALEKDPKRRYQTAKELREDLARVAAGQAVKHGSWLRQKGARLAAVALVILASAYVIHRLWPRPAPGPNYRVLAVLPIESGSDDAAANALVRGMAETVSARLAQEMDGQKLQLIPPSELIARGAKTTDAAQREFGVERVLEVSVQRSGGKVRITCSLVDPRTHQLLRACTVTGDGTDLFALQDKLAGEVIAMLPQDTRIEQAAPTEVHAAEPAAYEYYIRGRGYLLDYQKMENIDSAIAEFEHALQVSPNFAPAYAGLGEAYWRGYEAHRGKEWLTKATTNCGKALEYDPRFAEGHTCLGNIYNDTGRYDKAVGEFQRALAIDGNSTAAFNGLGEAYDRLSKLAEAEETYKRAIAARPQYWAVYNWLGFFYAGQARYADAVPLFKKAIELTPDNQRPFNNLGAMYIALGDYTNAIATLKRASELAPSRDSYENLGAAYFYQRDFPKAVESFQSAVKRDDKETTAWGYLGDALYWSQGRREDAANAYQKAIGIARAAIAVNPKDAGQYALVGEFSAMLDHKQDAINAIQKALTLDPTNAEIMFKAALVYNHFGDKQQTLSWLNKATDAGYSRIIVRDTPDFDKIRGDKTYQALLENK